MGEKRPAQEAQRAIAAILLHDWDPIGVEGAIKPPNDEYDSYVGGIYRLLASRAAPEAIASHLEKIESESMGLQPNKERALLTARKLCGLPV